MKKIGTLNARLSGIIAAMGHTDRLVICDCGLPIPRDAEVVDLALRLQMPRFLDTLQVILQELEVEGAVVAEEMEAQSDGLYQQLESMLPGVRLEKVSHEAFKQLTAQQGNIAFVRTGEATPYANVMLISGVTFGKPESVNSNGQHKTNQS